MHVLYVRYEIWTKNCKWCLELLASRTFKEYCCTTVRKRCCQWDSYFSTTCLTPFKNQLTLSLMLILRPRFSFSYFHHLPSQMALYIILYTLLNLEEPVVKKLYHGLSLSYCKLSHIVIMTGMQIWIYDVAIWKPSYEAF